MKKRINSIISTLSVTLALVLGFQLAGCATWGQNTATEKLVVQYATMKVVEADKDNMPARAAKIDEIAAAAQVFFDSESVTVSQLHKEVMKRLPPDLSPADRMLASALIDTVIAELQHRVGEGIVPPEKRYQVNVVLGWIREAASFYQV